MKKFIIGALVAATALMGVGVQAASATKPDEGSILIDGHKVFICHNPHNPHVILVDVASVDKDGNLKGGHGVWTDQTDLTSFTPHDSEGHAEDFLFLADSKPDKDDGCPVDVTVCIDGQTTVVDKSESLVIAEDVQRGACPPVSVFACLSGTITAFGPGDPADVDADLAAYLAANVDATEVASADAECKVPEVPETPVTPETPSTPVVTPETPATPVVPVAAPVTAAPKAAAPVVLPHTV